MNPDTVSAMYWLVLHKGMSYEDALFSVGAVSRSGLMYWAKKGRDGWSRNAAALVRWIDAA